MANNKATLDISSVIVDDFNAALRGCQMSARGFFYALIPLFEKSRSYGFLDMDTEELSHHFGLSLHHTRRYIYELKRKRIVRVADNGTLVCPILIRQRYKIGGAF